MAFDFNKGGVEDIGDGVFVYVGPEGDSNNGIIVTDDGIVSIDGFIKNYEGWMAAYKKIGGQPIRAVINTHDDGDHFTMNHLLRRQGAFIVSSEVCRDRIERKMQDDFWIDDLKRRSPALAHEATDSMALVPDVGIADKGSLRIGGERIELVHMGHGHCPGDMVVSFPERGVLFTGDLVFAGVHGRLKTADIGNLIAILDQLLTMPCKTIVPGHGRPTKGVNREAIEAYKDYLLSLSARVEELIANGVKPDNMANEFRSWKYAGWERSNRFVLCLEHIYHDVMWRSRFTKKAGFRDHMGDGMQDARPRPGSRKT